MFTKILKMNRFAPIIAVIVLFCSCRHKTEETIVDRLLAGMTIEEKIGQLNCPIGFDLYTKADDSVFTNGKFDSLNAGFPFGSLYAPFRADPWSQKTIETGLNAQQSKAFANKLQTDGIPYFLFEECPHGHMAIGATVFPTGIGMASTWDRELINEVGKIVGYEIKESGGNVGLGPVLDIARDPRWSRVEETFGEDHYLSGELGLAYTRGIQTFVPTVLKHFAAYGIPQGGHNGDESHVGTNRLMTDYIANFEKVVKGGAFGIMTSYNAIDGVPCTSNRWLLNDVLRNEWGFDGPVISDLGSIWGLQSQHHVAEDQVEAAALALNAGVDIDLGGSNYNGYLLEAYRKKLVSEATIDNAVRRVLNAKMRLGLFNNNGSETNGTFDRQSIARKAAAESIVLLKNDGTLPLKKDIRRIAVIGPNADNVYNQIGDYSAPQPDGKAITVLEGIRQAVSASTQVDYVRGCMISNTLHSDIEEAVRVAQKADAVVLVVGGSSARDFKTSYIETGAARVDDLPSDMECGEGCDRLSLNLLGHQEKLLSALADTHKPLIVVYIEGRPLNKNLADEKANALLTAWYPGEQGGNAVADVLFGDCNPAGRLPVSVPRHEGQIPVFYSAKQPNRYIEGEGTPLFAFGYGLSYTEFEYSNLEVELKNNISTEYNENETVATVTCTVSNVGERDGDEVVQLYVRDKVASVSPAERLLKGFERVHIAKGGSAETSFNLTQRDLATYNNGWSLERGEFDIMVGAASNDIRLSETITLR